MIMLYSENFDQVLMAPPLSEDDAFNSHPMLGNLAYRLPGLDELVGVPMNFLDDFQEMKFYLSVLWEDELGEYDMQCENRELCAITFHKMYTPVLYYLSPPVVYYNSLTELWFDPKSTPNLIRDLTSDELPFINAKIGGGLLDFEDHQDYLDRYS